MTRSLLLLGLAITLGACATAPALPPEVVPQGEDRFLVDPRTGYEVPSPLADDVDRRMEAAWRHFLAGDYVRARQRLAELRTRAADYAPAALLEAAIDLREGSLDRARHTINLLADQYPRYTAARVYQAELALAEGNTRRAWEIYHSLARQPDVSALTIERLATAERRLFDELVTAARDAEDLAAIPLLREALTINPGAVEARLLLVRRLLGREQYDEALRIVQPLVGTPEAEREDVQETLAEIDIGRGRYQEAIARYERLARRSADPHYAQRLEEVKEQWTLANLPPQFRSALESDAITRGDLAVLIYWKLPSVRFAQNLPSPPIAIDVAEAPGRDEIVRAMAIGLYEVDPVTRRVFPFRIVTGASFSRLAARLLVLRGAACAGGVPLEQVLAACRVSDPASTLESDASVSGRAALRVIEEIERALRR